jgi:hypothetical protein
MDKFKVTLIRRIFEVERDILWAESVEREAKKLGLKPEAFEPLRPAFNRHMTSRDWAWWRETHKDCSAGQLADMLADAVERADAIGIKQKQRDTGMSM